MSNYLSCSSALFENRETTCCGDFLNILRAGTSTNIWWLCYHFTITIQNKLQELQRLFMFSVFVLSGFINPCSSFSAHYVHSDYGGGEGQAQEEASGQGCVGGELQWSEFNKLLSVPWRHATLEPAQTPPHQALQVSLWRCAGPSREGCHPHRRYDVHIER